MAPAHLTAVGELQVPDSVRERIARVITELEEAAPGDIVGLVVYGSVARGRYVAGRSDVNLLVLLRNAAAETLRAIARPLHEAWRAVRVEPLIVTTAELPRVAAVFPVKLLDIQRQHVVIAGSDDALRTLVVPTTFARLRVEQELRNLELRLRRRYVAIALSPDEQLALLASIVRQFALSLAGLLEVDGRAVPTIDRTQAIFDSAAAAYGLDRAALAELAKLRQGGSVAGDPSALFDSVLATVTRAASIAGSGA